MSITMNEIAYMCNVSRGTVDRVLNNRGGVKPDTERKIREMAVSLGYGSTGTKSSPSLYRTFQIGFLINAVGHEYYTEILNGIMMEILHYPQGSITAVTRMSSGFDVDQQLQMLDELEKAGIQALAITAANHPRIVQRLNQFSARGVPVVILSALLDEFDYFSFVGPNHYQSGRIAGGYARRILPDHGTIAILTASSSMTGHTMRVKGFQDALLANGRSYTIYEPIQTFDDDVIAYKALSKFISNHRDISLFFFAAGGYSGGFQAIEDAGLFYKSQIIAFDTKDISVQYLKEGKISALFSQHPRHQGKRAVRIIMNYLLNKQIPDRREYYESIEILIDESYYPDSQLTCKFPEPNPDHEEDPSI